VQRDQSNHRRRNPVRHVDGCATREVDVISKFHSIDCTEFVARQGLDIDALSPVAETLGVSPSGPWLVGGSVRRLVTKKPQDSDFDVGLVDMAQLENVTERLTLMSFSQVADTNFHRELRGQVNGKDVRIQLLKITFADNPCAILDEFDFTICQCAYDGSRLFFGEYTLWDLGRRRLAIHRVTFASSTVRRMLKYGAQGFTACSGCIGAVLKAVVADPALIREDVQYVD
jgi:hypothetical protein